MKIDLFMSLNDDEIVCTVLRHGSIQYSMPHNILHHTLDITTTPAR